MLAIGSKFLSKNFVNTTAVNKLARVPITRTIPNPFIVPTPNMYSNNATKNVVTFPSIIAAIALLKLLSKAFFGPTLFLNSSFNLSKMITFASTAIPIDSISPAIPGRVILIPVFASTSIIILIYATKEILDNLALSIPVYGMQKNDKHRITHLVDPNGDLIEIEKNSDLFHFLETISEEVHRFAISYHKEIRSKGTFSSKLDEIPGIGKQRKKELLKKFGTLKGILDASDQDLEKIIPKSVIPVLKEYLQK